MAEIKSTLKASYTGELTLSESEMRVLLLLTGWKADSVFDAICTCVSKSEAEPYREAFKNLMNAVSRDVGPTLYQLDQIRRDIHDVERKRQEARRNAQST